MAKSIEQIQREIVLNNSLIEQLSQFDANITRANPTDAFQEEGFANLPVTERMILAYATEFIKKVRENLEAVDRVDTGALNRDIQRGQLINQSGVYTLEIGYPKTSKAAGYYDYVNKGVKGFDSKLPNSKYRFRNAKPSMNGPMVLAIQKWMKRNGLISRRETEKSTFTSLQRKRKRIGELDSSRVGAYLVARKIKSAGLPKTGFFDNAVNEYFGTEFGAAMAKAVGADIRVGVKQVNSLINDKNK
jgi:hypothetical protein